MIDEILDDLERWEDNGSTEDAITATEWINSATIRLYADNKPEPQGKSKAKTKCRQVLEYVIKHIDTLTDESAEILAESVMYALLEASKPGTGYMFMSPKQGRPIQGYGIFEILSSEVLEACREIMQTWLDSQPENQQKGTVAIIPILGYLLNSYLASDKPLGKKNLLKVLNSIAPSGINCSQKNFNRLTLLYERNERDKGYPGRKVSTVAKWMETKWPNLFNIENIKLK